MKELLDFDFAGIPLWTNGILVLLMVGVIGLGAHWLVEAASRIAKRFGVSELVIGLTIVAFGTSAPEFAVTIIAAIKGQGDISVGNIVGSNIFNLGFILGGCALVKTIPVSRTMFKRDGFVLGATTVLLLVLVGWDLRLDRYEGGILFGLLVAYLVILFRQRLAGKDGNEAGEDEAVHPVSNSLPRDISLLVMGLVAVIGGSHVMVESASSIARGLGVSEWVIGVTIIAAGTSTPELATSLAGVLKGRYALSAGNIIGSDIFNLLGVLGIAGMVKDIELDSMARISLAALCGMVFLVLFLMRTGWRLSRIEGGLLVGVAILCWILDFSIHSGP